MIPGKMTTRFKELLFAEEILMFPVSHDPLCAKIAEFSGFAAVSVGGYASSASMLARPDINLLTLTEMADVVRRTVNSVNIPVFADGDTGHGNVNNVKRTVELFEQAGAASLFIEDQVSPKRCGHMAGKEVIPPGEMAAKIKAAIDARKDPDLLIMARTDALAVNGIDDAIARAGSTSMQVPISSSWRRPKAWTRCGVLPGRSMPPTWRTCSPAERPRCSP